MKTMIVCINDKNPTRQLIRYINYDDVDTQEDAERMAGLLKKDYDSVYLVHFNQHSKELIEEIKKHGKKL